MIRIWTSSYLYTPVGTNRFFTTVVLSIDSDTIIMISLSTIIMNEHHSLSQSSFNAVSVTVTGIILV
jgi:hypothetical protein